jgi:hypothetical protein
MLDKNVDLEYLTFENSILGLITIYSNIFILLLSNRKGAWFGIK